MATNRGTTVREVVQRFGLDKYLEVAVGVLDVPRPKPFPDMLEKCAAHFAADPARILYVGDAATDLEAAQAAGMHFIGVREHTGGIRWVPEFSAIEPAIAALSQELEQVGSRFS
jgi:phosphoglycolate phosphatase-like HAD superfamily hydrolase